MTKNTTTIGTMIRLGTAAALLAAFPAMTGCGNKPVADAGDTKAELSQLGGDTFRPDDEPRNIHRVIDASAAAGARASATLYAGHFDGGAPGTLNSLGEEKLDLMLADDDALPLAIYVDVAKDDATFARHDAVALYLRDRGLAAEQIKVIDGPNPRTYAATAPKLKAAAAAEAAPTAAASGAGMGSATTAK